MKLSPAQRQQDLANRRYIYKRDRVNILARINHNKFLKRIEKTGGIILIKGIL